MTELKEGQAWFYAHSRDAEAWSGPYDDRADVIEAAKDENPHGTSYIGIGEEVSIGEAIGYFEESLLEWMEEGVNEHLTDNCLGGDDPLASFRDKAVAALELKAWAEKHLVIQPWYQIDGQLAEEVKFEGREAAQPFPCCGGSDEHPPGHTQDCSNRQEADGLNPEEADLWDEPQSG